MNSGLQGEVRSLWHICTPLPNHAHEALTPRIHSRQRSASLLAWKLANLPSFTSWLAVWPCVLVWDGALASFQALLACIVSTGAFVTSVTRHPFASLSYLTRIVPYSLLAWIGARQKGWKSLLLLSVWRHSEASIPGEKLSNISRNWIWNHIQYRWENGFGFHDQCDLYLHMLIWLMLVYKVTDKWDRVHLDSWRLRFLLREPTVAAWP